MTLLKECEWKEALDAKEIERVLLLKISFGAGLSYPSNMKHLGPFSQPCRETNTSNLTLGHIQAAVDFLKPPVAALGWIVQGFCWCFCWGEVLRRTAHHNEPVQSEELQFVGLEKCPTFCQCLVFQELRGLPKIPLSAQLLGRPDGPRHIPSRDSLTAGST